MNPRPTSWRKPLLALMAFGLMGVACSPPTVPLQGNDNALVNRFSNFRLQASSITFSNGKSLNVTNNGATFLNDVPYVAQGDDNTCGQAVMTMLLQYWGHDIDYQTVVDEGNPFNLGTSYDAIQNYLSSKDLAVQAYRGGSLEAILGQIHLGRPVMVLLDFGSLAYAHYVLVVGYNAQRNSIILHESRSGPYREVEVESFLEMWDNKPVVNLPIFGGANYERLMFAVAPKDQLTR